MTETYDVIVVGARCAGSPLATLLARRGLRVAVLERATFPRDTLSTHVFQAQALAFLNRLGVIDKLRETGAPLINRVNVRQEEFQLVTDIPQEQGDVGGGASVRRFILDPILADAAAEAGAEVRMGTSVTGVVQERGRVVGVRIGRDGSGSELRARLVVGADGRNSTVATLVGSRKYNLTPNERAGYYSYFEDAKTERDPAIVFHRWDGNFVIACQCDSGLYEVILLPEMSELPAFKADLERGFVEYARRCAPVAEAIDGAKRVGKIFGMVRWEGFFREPTGPGWALVGDAGHFKDPAPGQGIQDAFRQVDALAPVIEEGLGGSEEELDHALAAWGRWRDRDASGHYWFATDLGKAGRSPAVIPAMSGRLHAKGNLDRMLNVMNHRIQPSEAFTPPMLIAATARLLARPGTDRRAVLREFGGLIAEEARRQRLAKRPEYAPQGASGDAGETEVEEAIAA